MENKEFAKPYNPRFGDVVFTKEPVKQSRAIRVAQAISSGIRRNGIHDNFSHTAFVIDCNRIIHSIGSEGVHTVVLNDFFKANMEYLVLRPPHMPEVKPINATYYVGQKYDSKKDFLRRFIYSYFPENTQVCSTLVAQTLVNFGISEIQHPETTTPIKLHRILTDQDWIDVTNKYSCYISLRMSDDKFMQLSRENHEFLSKNLKSIQQSKKDLAAIKDLIISWNALQTKWATELGDNELLKQLEAELQQIDQIEEIEFAFHDTDKLSSDLFHK